MKDIRGSIVAVLEICNGQDVIWSECGYVGCKEEAIDRFIDMLEGD